MKRISRVLIAALLILVVGASAVFAAEAKIIEFKTSKFRNGERFFLFYDTFLKQYFIYEDSPFEGQRRLYMDDAQTELFIKHVKKAAAWRQIAIDNNAEINKELPSSAFSASYKVIYNASNRLLTEKGLAYIFLNFSYKNKNAEFKVYCPKYEVAGSVENSVPAFQTLIFRNDDINKFADMLDWDKFYRQERKLLGLPVEGESEDLSEGFDGVSGSGTNTSKKTNDSLFQ